MQRGIEKVNVCKTANGNTDRAGITRECIMLLPSSAKRTIHGTGGRVAFSAMKSLSLTTTSAIAVGSDACIRICWLAIQEKVQSQSVRWLVGDSLTD
jgi:hypothetical protein